MREKDPTEYNGWEQFVADLIPPARSPPMSTFLPRNTAISLQEHQEREAAESRQQVKRAERTAKLVEGIASAVESVKMRQDDAEKKLFDQAGGKLEAFYFCFGRWDGAVIADFASHVDVTAALMAIGRTAAFNEVDTSVLIEHEDAVRAMEIAREITNAYVAPAAA